MTLPATIRAVVDPQAITRVTSFFNGMLIDAVPEILQNSRRAGATRVEVETVRDGGTVTLVVRDDGRGIDDPDRAVADGERHRDPDRAARCMGP